MYTFSTPYHQNGKKKEHKHLLIDIQEKGKSGNIKEKERKG
jgi:hypothetical protein